MTVRDDTWLAEVGNWVEQAVGPDVELEKTRERPWGTIVRVTTRDGILFFKEPALAGRHESVIVTDLSERWHGLAPDVVASDHDRGWLLMHDHGTPMRDAIGPPEQVSVIEDLLHRYAEMQHRSLTDRWMTAGAPDRRIERLPALLDDVLLSRPLPLDADQRTAIEAARTDIERTDFRVSALDHSDMHDNNVLVGHGSPRIIDWGDSCVTHPFASLFVVYQHMVARCRADIRRDLALRLRDVYLDAWRDEAPAEVLRRSFAHALWLGYVIRALNFVHMNEAGYEDLDRDVAQFLVRWSQKHSLLNDPDEIVAAIANETEY